VERGELVQYQCYKVRSSPIKNLDIQYRVAVEHVADVYLAHDCIDARRDALCQKEGFRINAYYE
jgi:hypothetical protein